MVSQLSVVDTTGEDSLYQGRVEAKGDDTGAPVFLMIVQRQPVTFLLFFLFAFKFAAMRKKRSQFATRTLPDTIVRFPSNHSPLNRSYLRMHLHT